MVHLCVSITNDGLRLESVQRRSQESVQRRGAKLIDMATLQRKPKAKMALTRQDRGSCSSTSSCPVFSGPYSDHEDHPPLRRQSSPVLKDSLSNLHCNTRQSSKGSLLSLQETGSRRQESLSSFQESPSNFQISLPNLRQSALQIRRRSLSGLENSSQSPSEWSVGVQSGNGSSSDDDDDGSWDTNSWSSGATCLLRTPIRTEDKETSDDPSGKTSNDHQTSSTAGSEDEIIYQNLVFSHPAVQDESSNNFAIKVCKDEGKPSMTLPRLGKSLSSVFGGQKDERAEEMRKFSQFLNEVTCRVLNFERGPTQQLSTFGHSYMSPPPPPPSTPSYPLIHSTPKNPLSTSVSSLWYSPTSSNLQTIKECNSKDIVSSIQQWSKTLPSCKILEPEEVLRKIKGSSHSYAEHNLDLCTKIQTQPSTGRLYLETDIDRVRRLDELVANGTIGKDSVLEKSLEKAKEKRTRIPWERNEDTGMEKGKQRERIKENIWERNRGNEKGQAKPIEREKPCWEEDRIIKRGRDKEKKVTPNSYGTSLPKLTTSDRSSPCPVFSWPEGFPRMSYRSASLPRAANVIVSTSLH